MAWAILLLLPVPLRAGPAEGVELTGDVIVLQADDFDSRQTAVFHYLRDDTSGRWLRLHLAEGKLARSLATDSRVRLRGQLQGDEFTALGAPDPIESGAALAPAMTGKRDTLVIAINFQDQALPCSTDAIAASMFTGPDSVDGLYEEMSHGACGFTGDVVGPFTIGFDSASGACRYFTWADAADAAAWAAGVEA